MATLRRLVLISVRFFALDTATRTAEWSRLPLPSSCFGVALALSGRRDSSYSSSSCCCGYLYYYYYYSPFPRSILSTFLQIDLFLTLPPKPFPLLLWLHLPTKSSVVRRALRASNLQSPLSLRSVFATRCRVLSQCLKSSNSNLVCNNCSSNVSIFSVFLSLFAISTTLSYRSLDSWLHLTNPRVPHFFCTTSFIFFFAQLSLAFLSFVLIFQLARL